MLDPLDRMVEELDLPFVRYAVDFLVLAKTKAEALHALPSGFHGIRYYGFMHARGREKLQLIRRQLGMPLRNGSEERKKAVPPEAPTYTCPRCGQSKISIEHRSRAPPWQRRIPQRWKSPSQAA